MADHHDDPARRQRPPRVPITPLAAPPPVEVTLPTAAGSPRRQYPHVDDVSDWRAQQSLRLLWDRTYDLLAQLTAARTTIDDLVTRSNQQDDLIVTARTAAAEALAEALKTPDERAAAVAANLKDDQGKGQAGCDACGLTGDVGPIPVDQQTVANAGTIICGVGHEFPALLAATTTYAQRQTNREELMNRMVWHLNQAGFAASRYGTPGTPEHEFNLLFDCLSLDGSLPVRQYAYVVTTYDPTPTSPWDTTNVMQTKMQCNGQTPGQTTTPDAGTPD